MLLLEHISGKAQLLPPVFVGKHKPASCRFYVDPTFTPANVAATTLDTCFAANVVVPGPVYAQPLFLTLDKGGGLIILATEQAVVLAVDAATGEAGLVSVFDAKHWME